MKAKVIKTGEVVEVQQRANGSWASSNMNATKFFDESELDFEFQEWDAFRREAAKDILAGIATNISLYVREKNRCAAAVNDALALADELIKQLRNGKE